LLNISKSFYFIVGLVDILQCILAALRSRKIFDICISLYNTQFYGAYFLQRIGTVKKNVLFIYDYYIKDKFEIGIKSKLADVFYRASLKFSVKNADALWLLSPNMLLSPFLKDIVERRKKPVYSFETAGCVDLGDDFIRVLEENRDLDWKSNLGFLGNLSPHHGVDLILKVLPEIVRNIPKVKLFLIGSGPEEERLKAIVKANNLSDNVFFLGHIPDRGIMYKALADCAVGLAIYNPGSNIINYKYLGPGKTREYMAVGLPIVITRGAYFAEVIERDKTGFAIDYSADQLLAVLLGFLRDDHAIEEYRKRMKEFAKKFRYDLVMDKAVKFTVNAWQKKT
nr:glycosyltransferase [Candidatus Omnitrophota bacterium]